MVDRNVRLARPADAAAVAVIQLAVWRTTYAGILPADALAALTEPAMVRKWSDDLAAPPTDRHRVLVAVDEGRVVGLAASGPADGDYLPADAAGDAGELLLLLVASEHRNRGHGSRLLSAVVEHLRADGFATAYAWVIEAHVRGRRFLGAAGWAADGAVRELDMGRPVREVRLHTALP